MRAVDLIEDDDRTQANFKSLGEDKAGLRHRPFLGSTRSRTQLTSPRTRSTSPEKSGVAGGVYNINFIFFEEDTQGMFRKRWKQCRALFFLVIAIHRPFRGLFVLAEDIRLFKETVEHGRFSMVDVGDDGDIANFFWLKHK